MSADYSAAASHRCVDKRGVSPASRRWTVGPAQYAGDMKKKAVSLRVWILAAGLIAPIVASAATHAPTTDAAHRSATSAAPAASSANVQEALPQLQRWIEQSAASTWTLRLPDPQAGGEDGSGNADVRSAGFRVEVRFGRLNPGVRLAPCTQIEPFLPPNARLWGRSYVGVRCTAGASWSTMLPVTVSVYGPALVAALPISAGTMPRLEDFRIDEVDWTRSPGMPVVDPALLAGRSLNRPLTAGQVLRANDLRVAQTITAGDPVRIRMLGPGFSISATGFAMAGAGEGQSLRVRTENGRMIVGIVRERTVEVRL